MMPHTPGPWKVSGLHTEEIWAPDVVYGKRIAQTIAWPNHDCEANARLIAAAPKLLAACQHALGALEHVESLQLPEFERGWNEEIGELMAVIAEAIGEKGPQ